MSEHDLSEMEKGYIVTAFFIDLAKAFGTVESSFLLRKLHPYEVQGT